MILSIVIFAITLVLIILRPKPLNEGTAAALGAIAILVAWRTRNVLLTILAGMAALLIFQALLGLF